MKWLIITLIILCITFITYRYFIYRSKVGKSPEFTRRRVIYFIFLGFSILFGFGSVFQSVIERALGISDPNYYIYSLIGFSIFTVSATIITTPKKKRVGNNKSNKIDNRDGKFNINNGDVNLGNTIINVNGVFTPYFLITVLLIAALWFVNENYRAHQESPPEKDQEEQSETVNNETDVGIMQYELIGNYNQELINLLESSGKILIVAESEKRIKISHTANVFLFADDDEPSLYRLREGFITISVNKCHYTIKELKIPAMGSSPKFVIENELEKVINSAISNNTKLISEKILQCLD